MKCDRCNGQGFSVIAKWKCPACDGKGFVEPMTEQEWLQTATTEQLAELFVGVARDGADALKRCNGSFEPLNIYKHEFWVAWLKQPHTNKE